MSLAIVRALLSVGACCFGFAATAHAQVTRIHLKPITIPGATNVDAIAVNKKGVILGHYQDGSGAHSFLLYQGAVSTLPSPCGGNGPPCVPIATALNSSSAVVGYFYLGNATYSFLWQNGAYVTAGNFWLGVGDQTPFTQNYTVGINDAGEEYYSFWGTGSDELPVGYVGFPGNFQEVVPPPSGCFGNSIIDSISDHGEIAGYCMYSYSSFRGQDGHYKLVYGPDGDRVIGPLFINDVHHIAGVDLRTENGFVYSKRAYATFAFPTHYGIGDPIVQAISNAGRVVGTYYYIRRHAEEIQRAFIYNGSTVTSFGRFTSTDDVRVALNDSGDIVLSHDTKIGRVSYRVICRGSGC